MSPDSRLSGQQWEDYAARAVTTAGLQILTRRYLCRLGEIDIVALERRTLVFIEVRYRANRRFADAAASVSARKQRRILSAARHFLMRFPEHAERSIRMDVIALQACEDRQDEEPQMRWIRGAFEAHDG